MTLLLDSNALIDLTMDSAWAPWVQASLDERVDEPLAINQLIFAEVSTAYSTPQVLRDLLEEIGILRLNLPWEAAFPAGQAFLRYRRAGGVKTSPISDFYTGAHAQVAGFTILTRDPGPYRTYFPEVPLVAPS